MEKTKEAQPTALKRKLFDPKLALLLLGLLVAWFVFISMIPAEYNSPYETINVSFKAIANGETILDTTAKVAKGTNAFDAMQEVASIEFQDFGSMGVMVESINGTTPKENEFWKLFVNGEEATVGISSIVIEDNMQISWKIASFEDFGG